jgi:hypothetical protein
MKQIIKKHGKKVGCGVSAIIIYIIMSISGYSIEYDHDIKGTATTGLTESYVAEIQSETGALVKVSVNIITEGRVIPKK